MSFSRYHIIGSLWIGIFRSLLMAWFVDVLVCWCFRFSEFDLSNISWTFLCWYACLSVSCTCVILFSFLVIKFFFSFHFQTLNLAYNEISKIHPFAFKDLNALVRLNISYNKLTSVPTIECVKPTPRDLNLAWNHIKLISDTYFDSGMKLTILESGCDQLIDIPNMRYIARILQLI